MKIIQKVLTAMWLTLGLVISEADAMSRTTAPTPEELAAETAESISDIQSAAPNTIGNPAMQATINATLNALSDPRVAQILAKDTKSSYAALQKKAVTTFQKSITGSIAKIFKDKKRTMQKIRKDEQMAYEKAWKIVVRDRFCTPLDNLMNARKNPRGAREMQGYLNSISRSDRNDVRALCGINSYSKRVGNKDVALFPWA